MEIKFRRRFKSSSRRFGDLDNLIKGVLDALIGIVFSDDAQVVKVTAQKETAEKVGVDVLIEPAQNF